MKFRILLLLPLFGVFGASAFEVNQVFREERFTRGNVNLRPLQEIDNASWIWPDGVVYGGDSRPVVRFRAEFEGRQEPLRLDVSADARFVLILDGREIARGPHKGFPEHWYYQTYDINGLEAGRHRLAVYMKESMRLVAKDEAAENIIPYACRAVPQQQLQPEKAIYPQCFLHRLCRRQQR